VISKKRASVGCVPRTINHAPLIIYLKSNGADLRRCVGRTLLYFFKAILYESNLVYSPWSTLAVLYHLIYICKNWN